MPVNSNLAFAQGVVEQLAGDSNLIAVRSRASRERPFTVVQKMQADAERQLSKQDQGTRTKSCRHPAQSERAAEKQRWRPAFHSFAGTAAGARQFSQDRSGRKSSVERNAQETAGGDRFAREPDKWLNIALMPVLVIIAGFVLAADETQARRSMKGKQLTLFLDSARRFRRRRSVSSAIATPNSWKQSATDVKAKDRRFLA